MDARGIDDDPGWINRRLQKIERAIERLGTERRAAATSVETGNIVLSNGGSLVVDGGDVLMLDEDGSEIFRVGPQQHGDRGLTVSREDGSIALQVRKPFGPTGTAMIQLFDVAGNELLGEEVFGNGLNRPYLQMPTQPVLPATPGTFGWSCTTTSATFVDLFRWQGARQNQWYRPVFNVVTSDLTTAAEVRVVDGSGGVLTPFLAAPWVGVVPTGSTADQELKPPNGLGLGSAYGAPQVVRIQARRTAGAGTVTVTVKASEGGSA